MSLTWEQKLFRWADSEIGGTVDLFRGLIPRPIAVVEFALESGIDPYMLAGDEVISEMGIPGVEVARYFNHNVDPCDRRASIWLGCSDLIEDATRYVNLLGAARIEDIWYLCFLDFSIGTGAVRHVLSVVGVASDGGRSVMDRAVAWSKTDDFDRPVHKPFWGRQGPELVRKRISKQRQRILWAREMGPLSEPG